MTTSSPESRTEADKLMSLGDAADRLGYTYRHVRRLIQGGQLVAVNIGDTRRGPTWRISPSELARFEAERSQA